MTEQKKGFRDTRNLGSPLFCYTNKSYKEIILAGTFSAGILTPDLML